MLSRLRIERIAQQGKGLRGKSGNLVFPLVHKVLLRYPLCYMTVDVIISTLLDHGTVMLFLRGRFRRLGR